MTLRVTSRAWAVAFALGFAALAGCGRFGSGATGASGDDKPVQTLWRPMGTYAAVSVPAAEAAQLPRYAAAVSNVFAQINGLMSTYIATSEVCRINQAAGRAPVTVSADTRKVLQEALRYGELSGGAFDVTVAPLVFAWGFSGGKKPEHALAPEAVRDALTRVGYRHLKLSGDTAFLEQPGMAIDLGGIAKGYAVDVAFDALARLGAKNVMVNLGGSSLRCVGNARPGRPWTIGVDNPFERGNLVGTVHLTGGLALATSGNYEKFVELDGKRYTHILDPRTGYPVEGVASVTVVTDNATAADALSKPFFVLGLARAKEVLERLPGCSVVIIPDRQPLEIWVSPGARRLFEPFPDFAGAVREL